MFSFLLVYFSLYIFLKLIKTDDDDDDFFIYIYFTLFIDIETIILQQQTLTKKMEKSREKVTEKMFKIKMNGVKKSSSSGVKSENKTGRYKKKNCTNCKNVLK